MTKEVKIGLIGIAALAMLIFGINYLKGINMFQSANYYYVEYTNINGLAGSSPVFANGYKVGTVRNINYNYAKPGHVTVEVEVDKEMRIPKGSTGELVTEMLGTVKMNLLLNFNSTEYYQPGDTLPGIDRATDVLSFPLFDYEGETDEPAVDGFGGNLGDIVISLERAKEQAEEFGHSFERECAFLTVHSTLHLLGYDHIEDDEAEVMEARERELLTAWTERDLPAVSENR